MERQNSIYYTQRITICYTQRLWEELPEGHTSTIDFIFDGNHKPAYFQVTSINGAVKTLDRRRRGVNLLMDFDSTQDQQNIPLPKTISRKN